MKITRKLIVLVILCLTSASSLASDHSDISLSTSEEISHLLAFVANSGCTFERNGRSYDSHKASNHIDRKYNYVRKKGLVDSAEDFIKYSATESSFSGRDYFVTCGEVRQPSGEWLLEELTSFREAANGSFETQSVLP